MKKISLIFLSLLLTTAAFAQFPDKLSKEFHKERRTAFRAQMPANSVAVFFANPVRNRANDVDYVYHQDPDFFYLTGYKEPNAALVIFSKKQKQGKTSIDEAIYVQERNAGAEQWTGKRLGIEGAKSELGFANAYNAKDFLTAGIEYTKFSKVLFYNFNNDIRNGKDKADLHDLIANFKTNINFPDDYNPRQQQLYTMVKSTDIENSANVAQTLGRYLNYYTDLKKDKLLTAFVSAKNNATRKELKQRITLKTEKNNLDTSIIGEIMNRLRETKTKEELVFLKKAIEISAVGQREVMKAMHPNMSELEVQGVHEFVYKKYNAEYEGYPSIVGAGGNGCILHYIDNNKPELKNELVLMDLGAEYRGYTADVTRTIPANGKFSVEQKAIYNIVYKAQEDAINASVIGAEFGAANTLAKNIINEGLAKLGIIATASEKHNYFPHGLSHYLGLDVHDKGTYGPLKENTVITVEPGIYIPEGSQCDKKWWGIAVRIEDDILITKKGPINLSDMAPRTVDDIEALMKEESPLNSFVLPSLD